jgi:hypothetical protein
MRSGKMGFLIFTFSRKHDAGLMQAVSVDPGTRLRISAWAHAWSNHEDASRPQKFPHPDNPNWSEGAGFEPFFALEGETDNDALRNFTFWVGCDPTGGTDALADSVVWGQGAHIYNVYRELPAVETIAQAPTVTVFLRSRTLWPFKHNDAYFDDAVLESVKEPPSGTLPHGLPREQYERTYVLLPPGADAAWARAVVETTWDSRRYTVGSSADDAGLGALQKKNVIAVNPDRWPSDLKAFFEEHYPGTKVLLVTAATPDELRTVLSAVAGSASTLPR